MAIYGLIINLGLACRWFTFAHSSHLGEGVMTSVCWRWCLPLTGSEGSSLLLVWSERWRMEMLSCYFSCLRSWDLLRNYEMKEIVVAVFVRNILSILPLSMISLLVWYIYSWSSLSLMQEHFNYIYNRCQFGERER